MLQNLLSSIPAGNKRYPLVYYRMLQILQERLEIARAKFVNQGTLPRTAGAEFLRFMLLNFDLQAAEAFKSDGDLYVNLVSGYQDKFRTVFDPCWCKSLSLKKFTKGTNNVNPVEIFLNTSLAFPASDLPLDEDWAAWSTTTRAVKFVYHPSGELPIDLYNGFVSFTKDPPSFVMMSINVPVLLMKWVKYNQWCKKSKKEVDELEFLKTSEYEYFFYDLLQIWTTNMILKTVQHKDASAESICSELHVPAFITNEGILVNGVTALQEQFKLLDSRNLKLQDFLDTDWYDDNSTIRTKIGEISTEFVLPDLRPYQWMEIFKYLPYLKMVSAVIDNDPENPLFKPLIRKAYNLYVKKIKFAQLPSTQYSAALKNYISISCKEFDQLFEGKIDAPTEITA